MVEINKERVNLEFRHAYHKCKRLFLKTKKIEIKHDYLQRIDEILLIYAAMFDVTVNEADELLSYNLNKAKVEE